MKGRQVKEDGRERGRLQEKKERGRKVRNKEILPSAYCNNVHSAIQVSEPSRNKVDWQEVHLLYLWGFCVQSHFSYVTYLLFSRWVSVVPWGETFTPFLDSVVTPWETVRVSRCSSLAGGLLRASSYPLLPSCPVSETDCGMRSENSHMRWKGPLSRPFSPSLWQGKTVYLPGLLILL